jgi:hypothetical protein
MMWTDIVALIACAIGGGLGLYAMINPAWASKLVRLVPTAGQVEGKSEFRATYGGLFLGGHAFAAYALVAQINGPVAAAAVGAGWMGSSVGRMLSIAADKTGTKLNAFNVAFELALGLALAAPLLLG